MDLTISLVTVLAADNPIKKSFPLRTSANVPFSYLGLVRSAISTLYLFIFSVLPL